MKYVTIIFSNIFETNENYFLKLKVFVLISVLHCEQVLIATVTNTWVFSPQQLNTTRSIAKTHTQFVLHTTIQHRQLELRRCIGKLTARSIKSRRVRWIHVRAWNTQHQIGCNSDPKPTEPDKQEHGALKFSPKSSLKWVETFISE